MARQQSSSRPGAGLGLFDSAKALLATLIGIVHNRLELLSTELQEEVERVALMLLWGAVALLFAFLAFAFLALLILIAFWDDHRMLVAALLTAAFLILALVAGFAARKLIAAKPRPFAASLNELAKDREELAPKP